MADNKRLKDLRLALKTASDTMNGITDEFDIEDGGGVVVSEAQTTAFRKALKDSEDIKARIRMVESADEVKAYLGGSDEPNHVTEDVLAQVYGPRQAKSLSQAYLSSDSFKEAKAANFRHMPARWEQSEGEAILGLGTKDVFGGSAGSVSIPGLGSSQQTTMTPRALRPNHVGDLFPNERTSATVLYGVRETGFVNAARPVPQRETETNGTTVTQVFGRKPKSDVTLVTITYPVATIAHTMDVHKNVLADEPRLQGILDRDMIDGLRLAEDEQILYGDGVGENITGLFNTVGTQSYAQSERAADKKSAAIRRAATRAALAYFPPTGVVLHPFDWEDVELEEDGQGGYRVAVSVAIGAEKRIWRMDVVDTPAIRQRQFLVGAFGQAAKWYNRELAAVTASTENRDNYERNVVTMRAESRSALEVPRPEALVEGAFAA